MVYKKGIQRLGVLLCLFAVAPVARAETAIYMLGTGTPAHNPARSGPAVAIVVDGTSYLFDFGPGVVRRAAVFAPRYGGDEKALDAGQLNIAFLTHLHSDHSAGFADLLLTGWSSGKRAQRMRVYGPQGINELVDGVHDAYLDDIKYRLYHRGKTPYEGWQVDVQVIREGKVYEDEKLKVIAFPVLHGNWPNAFGYRVETKDDKVIVISGDLAPNEKIREYSKNADYLIHEVYCYAGYKKRSESDQKYHGRNHTSTKELAQLANEVRPGTLVLTHVLWFGCTPEHIVNEIAEDYEGKVILANDLDVYR